MHRREDKDLVWKEGRFVKGEWQDGEWVPRRRLPLFWKIGMVLAVAGAFLYVGLNVPEYVRIASIPFTLFMIIAVITSK